MAEVVGESEQTLVAGELIADKEAAEKSDRNLEILDVDVAVERELALY